MLSQPFVHSIVRREISCGKEVPPVQVQWFALASFVVVTTFTPGPNNISAMSLGVSSGYRKSLRFLSGVTVGFFGVMCLCALLAAVLLSSFPALQPALRIVGALYIAWLAVHTFLGSMKTEAQGSAALGFTSGLMLQLLNAKVIIYGLTLYSTFLGGLAGRAAVLALFALAFALVGFAGVSLWAGLGSSLTRILSDPRARVIISIVLSALLLWSAVESSGILPILLSARHVEVH
jgi:cysteine/O-acetylserine efflux protein